MRRSCRVFNGVVGFGNVGGGGSHRLDLFRRKQHPQAIVGVYPHTPVSRWRRAAMSTTATKMTGSSAPPQFRTSPPHRANDDETDRHGISKRRTTESYSHQRGYGRIVAVSSTTSSGDRGGCSTNGGGGSTRLTEISHASPLRLVPSQRSTAVASSALVHVCNYGGGLVPGDSLHLDVEVRGRGAALALTTQGGTRVYRPGDRGDTSYQQRSSNLCRSSVSATVDPGASLFYFPDPTAPYRGSSLEERRTFRCLHRVTTARTEDSEDIAVNDEYDGDGGGEASKKENREKKEASTKTIAGSIVAVDWYSAGRGRGSSGMEGERWAFERLSTRTELHLVTVDEEGNDVDGNGVGRGRNRGVPALIEAATMDHRGHFRRVLEKERQNQQQQSPEVPTPTASSMGPKFDAFATVLFHGPTALLSAHRAVELSRRLVGSRVRVRSRLEEEDEAEDDVTATVEDVDRQQRRKKREDDEEEEITRLLEALGGDAIVGVTPVRHSSRRRADCDADAMTTHVMRIVAESNEDVYRLLHHCLKPLAEYTSGFEPYADRIHSSKTSPAVVGGRKSEQQRQRWQQQHQQQHWWHVRSDDMNTREIEGGSGSGSGTGSAPPRSNSAHWRMCMLADSSLPVGSFAHSAGLEAAMQLGVFGGVAGGGSAASCSTEALSAYIAAVSLSGIRLAAPFIFAGHGLVSSVWAENNDDDNDDCADLADEVFRNWIDIDACADAVLAGNGPGRRASIDQGMGLARIASSFVAGGGRRGRTASEVMERIRHGIGDDDDGAMGGIAAAPRGHAAPIFGIHAAALEMSPLEASRVFGFGAARDVVSAAVRLNLLGPMAGVSVLDGVARPAVEEGLEQAIDAWESERVTGLNFVSGGSPGKRSFVDMLECAATCAPIMDAAQPCHDVLQLRLFRT